MKCIYFLQIIQIEVANLIIHALKAVCSGESQNLSCGKDFYINDVLVTPETTLISKIPPYLH